MANVSGTKVSDPLKDVQAPEDPERVLPALGPELTTHQPTELELQASAAVVDDDEDEDGKKKAKAKKEELFPVKLLRNYRPLEGSDFVIGEPNPHTGKPWREPTQEERLRLPAGMTVKLPLSEAKRAIQLKIGERNDPIGGK